MHTRRKIFTALLMISMLLALICGVPVAAMATNASGTPTPTSVTPTPTPTCLLIILFCSTPTPTSSTPTPTSMTPTPKPGSSATPTPTPTPTPKPKPKLALIANAYRLTATEIDAVNAHLDISDPLHPILTFSSATIFGLKITHPLPNNFQQIISASGTVTSTGDAIKTSVLNQLQPALSGSISPADLLVLTTGGTVVHMTMKNVDLQVDSYLRNGSIILPGFYTAIVPA